MCERRKRLSPPSFRETPDSAEALHGLGRLRGMRGELALGEEHLAEAVRLEPDLADAWADLGNVYLSTDRLEEAVASYQKALFLDETNALVWCNLGLCQQKRSELANASKNFRRALELNPRFDLALRQWVAVQVKLDWPEGGQNFLERLAHDEPDHAEAHAALGFMLLKRCFLPSDALVHFDRALAWG